MEDNGAKCLVLVKRRKNMIIPRDDHDQYDLSKSTKVMMKRFGKKLSWEGGAQEDRVAAEEGTGGDIGGGGGGGGGCGWLWPPRSYSCSFCKREFRSAQALGGHMNIHRRDRAMLKQVVSHHKIIDPPPPLPSSPLDHLGDHDHDDHRRHGLRSPSKSKATPFPSHDLHHIASAPLLFPTRVSSAYYSQDYPSGIRKAINTHNFPQMKMPIGMNFSTRRHQNEEEDEERESSSKRCKKSNEDDDGGAFLPLFGQIRCSNVHDKKQSTDLQATTKPMEDLDLELRLALV